MKDFFYFNDKFAQANFLACTTELKTDENGKHPEWQLIRGNYDGIDFPVIFKQEGGKKLVDILGTGWCGLYLISDRMKKALKENHLTGWKTYPVKVYDKKGNEVFGYNGFSITGRCSELDHTKSEIIEKQFVPNGPFSKYYKGVWIDQWDGTDFFMPANTGHHIITKKAADVLKKNKFNVILYNIAEYETDVSNVKQKISE